MITYEIKRLLEGDFMRPCRYAEWVSNIVLVENDSSKLRVCINFRNLNRATPKDKYSILVVDISINNTSSNRVISFLYGNAIYNQISMVEEDTSKIGFVCTKFIGLFEWAILAFRIKNASTTYQSALNLIVHELFGDIVEIYIDDIVVKSTEFDSCLADLWQSIEKMC